MEADWEIEIGGDAPACEASARVAPVIDAHWPGFVDLRHSPELAWTLPETTEFPLLAAALIELNAASSPFWSAKCDLWPFPDSEELDPDELDAPPENAKYAMGCYIDLLPRDSCSWPTVDHAVDTCKCLCNQLHGIPLRSCRVDLIVRQAILAPDEMSLGITAYLTACGATATKAAIALEAALAVFVLAVTKSDSTSSNAVN